MYDCVIYVYDIHVIIHHTSYSYFHIHFFIQSFNHFFIMFVSSIRHYFRSALNLNNPPPSVYFGGVFRTVDIGVTFKDFKE